MAAGFQEGVSPESEAEVNGIFQSQPRKSHHISNHTLLVEAVTKVFQGQREGAQVPLLDGSSVRVTL